MQGPFGVYDPTPPTLSDKDQAQLQLNSDGSLKVGGAGRGLNGTMESVAYYKGPALRRFQPEDHLMSRKG